MITIDNDYSYIEVFIKFLREILAMIQKLVAGVDLETLLPLGNNKKDDSTK